MVRKYATPEEAREVQRARNREASKRRKAERALAEGRVPGVVGGPRRLSDDERAANQKAAYVRWRERNIEHAREIQAASKRRERRKRAEAEGRKLQKVGGDPKLTSEERRERAMARSLAYWKKHPERRVELARQYYEAHKEDYIQKARNRRARKVDAGGTFNRADIEFLLEQQKGRCVFCLGPFKSGKFEVDHHHPLALGGTNDRSNLKLLHSKCNRSKGARAPEEHAQRNGMLCW